EGTEWTGTGEFLGGLAGGTVAGLPGAAKAGVKSAQAIKDLAGRAGIKQAADAAYDEIRTSPTYMTRPQSMAFMQEVYDDVFGKRGNWDKRTAATTYGMLTDFYRDFASKPKNFMADILAFYKKLNAVHPSARGGYEDAAAASQMRRSILDILQRDVAQDRDAFGRAMGNWTAQKKLEELEKAGMVAEHKRQASGTGQNLNTIRQQMRQILDNEKRARGYTDAEKAQMEHIINGGTWDNALRWVDKGFSPANPLGAKSSLISMLLSLPITVAVGGAGLLTHRIGDYLNDREMERLINMVQMRAPVNVRSGASARAQTLMDAYDAARRRARHSAYRGGANALANPGTDIPEADDEGDAQ
ncbi:MAG TPA: hypothetical protein VKD24_02710, partial [Candidatus Angelobacter sp.]|nr:hypothetical protein [Candidatus Angelobacter sp.]